MNNLRVIIFTLLVKSKAFHGLVNGTEKSLLKTLRYLLNPSKADINLLREELRAAEELAKKAREAKPPPKINNSSNNVSPEYPLFLPKSIVDNYRMLKYEFNVWRRR